MNPCSSSSSEFSINYKGNIIPITYSKFQHRLRELIAKICLNPKLFSSHRFRRGGATLAAQAGISSSLIQLMEDWKSDAYNKYIVCSLTDKFMVAEKNWDFILK
jgi:integrase